MTRIAVVLCMTLCLSAASQIACCQEASHEEPAAVSFIQAGEYGNAATFQVALGDLDGDGDLDAVFANMDIESQIWMNDGTGQFTNSRHYLGAYGHGVAIGDIDGDSDLDLVFAQASTSFSSQVYLNNGSGRFVTSRHHLGDRSEAANSVSLFDADGDGDLDASVYYANRYSRLYLNNGSGQFAAQETSLPGMPCWGDLDGDGDVDALAQQHEGGYILFKNQGDAVFESTSRIDAPTAFLPGGTALGDVDGDGDLDLLGASGGFSRIAPLVLLKNDGIGNVIYSPNSQFLAAMSRISLGDFNNDGSLDVFLGSLDSPDIIGLNDGGGNYADAGLSLGEAVMTGASAVGDLDGDGDLDLFAARYGEGGPNIVWLNASDE